MVDDIQIVDLYDNSLGSFYNYTNKTKKKSLDFSIGKIISVVSTIVLVLSICLFYQDVKASTIQQNSIDMAKKEIQNLYQDLSLETPKLDITIKDINKVKTSVSKISDSKQKKYYLNLISDLYKFEAVKSKLYDCFDGDTILSSTTSEDVASVSSLISTLNNKQKTLLIGKYTVLLSEFNYLEDTRKSIRSLFNDDELNVVREDVTSAELAAVSSKINSLSQTDEVERSKTYLDKVSEYLKAKEKKAEAEAAYMQLVQNSNVEISGVPYISQTVNKVYNGCEAASLLMALQYKGIAREYDLATFATMMPKHESDPHQGFINSIFDVAPLSVTHWIAPDALAAFGSKFSNVTNISGTDAVGVKQYLEQGIPVIVYGTFNFDNVTKWYGEVPLNLHVMLAIGYNKITGDYILNDPWSGKITVNKDKFEKIYNQLKYAVIVE